MSIFGTECPPRIDAIDVNSINGFVNNYFDIVFCHEFDIWNFPILGECSTANTNNWPVLNCTTEPFIAAPDELTDISGYRPEGDPVVACLPNSLNDGMYGLAYHVQDVPNNDYDVFEQHIDWNCGYFDTGVPDYYEVDNHGGGNGTSYGPVALSNGWASDLPDYQFVCWFKDVPAGAPQIAFKLDNSYTPLFKPRASEEPAAFGTAVNRNAIKISPNPVKDILAVEGLAGKRYIVQDVLGRTMTSGELASGNEKLNLEYLPKGLYLIEVEGKGQAKFIKE